MNDSDDIVKEFLVESCENLDRLDRDLITLEKNPNDREILASIFRTIHTIKGTSGFLAFNQLGAVTHVGESLLGRLRDGQLELDREITSALLAMVDAVRQMLASIEATGGEGERDDSGLISRLTGLQQAPETPAKASMETPVKSEVAAVPESSSEAAALPSSILESSMGDILMQRAGVTPEEILVAAEKQKEGDPRHMGEILVEQGVARPADVVEALHLQQAARGPSASDRTIRLDVSLLDQLMNLVGELVLARNQILQFANNTEESGLVATSQRLNLITTELQEGVMKTRMQPIGNIWSKFPRTVRDLALDCGKQVRVEMEGEETELDKTLIEAIKDPLTHLVRNSVDHGIEHPEVRQAAGKDPEGRLFLRAFHEGGQVNIEISDDGAGLDQDRIRNKAVQKGLISAEQAGRLTDHEIVNLVFQPGFSTAEKVTNVSGRGVGMDVVKTHIEKIGGTVDLQSKAGQGVTVRMKIPLTLAIIPALIVTSAGERYAVPQVNLLELVRVERGAERKGIETIHGAPVYRLRGRLLPLVYLNRELQTDAKAPDATSAAPAASAAKTDLLDFAKARLAHEQWLGRLRQVLDGSTPMTVEQAGSPTQCALGKWLYGSGLKDYSGIREINQVEASHKRFHELVREVVALKAKGDTAGAEHAFLEVGPVSRKVVELLTEVERKVLQCQAVNIVVLEADGRHFGLVVDEINDTEEIVVKPLGKHLKHITVYSGATIMGDGKVALILDVIGLAQRASLLGEGRERILGEEVEATAEGANGKQQLVLFTGPADSRMAVPLNLLARLENIPGTQVERSGNQWVTQYRGQILPLIRVSHALEERRHRPPTDDVLSLPTTDQLQVLVLENEHQSFGLVVNQILDIVESTLQPQSPATRAGVLHSSVIAERVTELLDVPALLRAGEAYEPAVSHPAES
ncbi:MAG TPA: chemotaxis protein CheW [Terriglobales bacterium]|nr:chemotaxis protein CheW [Terriglobales bacterium]